MWEASGRKRQREKGRGQRSEVSSKAVSDGKREGRMKEELRRRKGRKRGEIVIGDW